MTVPTHDICAGSPESVFERCSWFYALCRELLFTDHTDEIAEHYDAVIKAILPPRPVGSGVRAGILFFQTRQALSSD